MDDAISAIEYIAIQAIFIWLSAMKMTKKEMDQQQDVKGSISAAITWLFLISIRILRMDAIKCSGGNPAICFVTWRVASRNDGSYHMDTADDDDVLDGIAEKAYIYFTKGAYGWEALGGIQRVVYSYPQDSSAQTQRHKGHQQ